ncbi:MAG: DUF433 domain-containing protein [Planctomycetota bacterium]
MSFPDSQLLEPGTLGSKLEGVIWARPDVMHGTPCFHGTRLPVKSLFDHLAAGDSLDDFVDSFPVINHAVVESLLERLGEILDELPASPTHQGD